MGSESKPSRAISPLSAIGQLVTADRLEGAINPSIASRLTTAWSCSGKIDRKVSQ